MNYKGHLNVNIKDHDSSVTGFGVHDRVICFQPKYDSEFECVVMYCHIDHKWGLGAPSSDQILKVARLDQYITGKFELIKSDTVGDGVGSSTDVWFAKQ